MHGLLRATWPASPACADSLLAIGGSPRRQAFAKRGARGFTLPELIAVLMLVSILAVATVPKVNGVLSFRDAAWRDEVVAALRQAHKTAISHRRLVCADITTGSVALSIASINPANACAAVLMGGDGSGSVALNQGAALTSVSPPGTLFFQPSGRVSSDAAGVSAQTRRIDISGQSAVVIVGETGHVE